MPLRLLRLNQPIQSARFWKAKRALNQAQATTPRLKPWLHRLLPSLVLCRPNLWWRCAGMTGLAKRNQTPPRPSAGAMAARASAVHGLGPIGVPVAPVTGVVSDLVTGGIVVPAAKAEISGKTGVPVWAMRPSARNARPWSGPRCRCANWRPKPMVKP